MPPTINQSERDYSVRHCVCTYAVLTNQSAAIAYVTLRTSQGVRTLFDQSARGYSIRHGAYVRCFNQSERDYSVRHGVYIRCLTNKSVAIAYVTVCTSRLVYVTHCAHPSAHPCTPLCISLCAHPSAHPFVPTPLHIPLCTPLCTSLHTPKKGG